MKVSLLTRLCIQILMLLGLTLLLWTSNSIPICNVLVDPGHLVNLDFQQANDLQACISSSVEKEYKKVWGKIISDGRSLLPDCVYDSLMKLKKSNNIYIRWVNICGYEVRGDKAGAELIGQYKNGDIYLYCVYLRDFAFEVSVYNSETTKLDFIEKTYCLKGLLLHELLHKAILEDSDNKKINGSDEALVEDCELKLFPCGPDTYKYAEGGEYWPSEKVTVKKDGKTRAHNPAGEDC